MNIGTILPADYRLGLCGESADLPVAGVPRKINKKRMKKRKEKKTLKEETQETHGETGFYD